MNNEKVIKLIVLFYMCSILGYFYELLLNLIMNHKVLSHGLLNGPYLPIYGTGALVIMLLEKYQNNPLIIFFSSFILTGLVEYIGGFLLLHVLKMRLWDYTGMLFNISGFVCFLSAFCFGIGGLLVIYIIYPLVEKLYQKVNKKIIYFTLSIITIIFGIDVIASIKN